MNNPVHIFLSIRMAFNVYGAIENILYVIALCFFYLPGKYFQTDHRPCINTNININKIKHSNTINSYHQFN